MAMLIDERFETSVWNSVIGPGGSINEHALTSDVNNPTGWETKCLKIINSTSGACRIVWDAPSPLVTSYCRIEFIVTSESLSDGEYFYIFKAKNSNFSSCWDIMIKQNSGGQLVLRSLIEDGSGADLQNISLNTLYRIDVKWVGNGGAYEMKVNGVSKRTGTTTLSDSQFFYIGQTDADYSKAMTVYFDLFAVDNSNWVS